MLGEDFIFDGISSATYGLKMIRVASSGFLIEEMLGSANITEIEHPNDFKPHLQKITRSPIEFTRQIVLLDEYGQPKKWTDLDRKVVANWFFHNEYKELIFLDRPEVVYNVIASTNLSLNTMGDRGYLEITFHTNSPYAWKKEREIVVPANINSGTQVTISIDPYIATDKVFPRILLEREAGHTTTTLLQVWVGNSSPGNTISLRGSLVSDVDKFFIDSKFKSITNYETGKSLYRYKGISGFDFPYLTPGSNVVNISKGLKATITFQEPIIY